MSDTMIYKRSATVTAVYLFTLAAFSFALITTVATAINEGGIDGGERIILFQLTVGTVFLGLPRLLSRVLPVEIPSGLSVAYMLFLFAAIFLGEFALFYYRVPLWDNVLHVYSAVLLTLVGLSLPRLFFSDDCSAGTLALTALGFSVLVGVLWEIYEFAFDGILGLNMQKFAALAAYTDGKRGAMLSPLVGRAALADTMTDLIEDVSAAAITAIWGFFRIKRYGSLPASIALRAK